MSTRALRALSPADGRLWRGKDQGIESEELEELKELRNRRRVRHPDGLRRHRPIRKHDARLLDQAFAEPLQVFGAYASLAQHTLH